MDLSSMIIAVQRAVGVKPDGVAGPITWAAVANRFGIVSDNPIAEADPRSESFIVGLNPEIQPLARKHLALLKARGLDAKIISGYRTYEEQANLYDRFKRGGSQAAPPGYSNHNFGLAYDLGLFKDEKYLEESPLYRVAGELGKEVGLIWGGDWTNSDEPHFEYRPEWAADMTESQALAEYRARNLSGQSLTA